VEFVEKGGEFSEDERACESVAQEIAKTCSEAGTLNIYSFTVNERKKPATPP
jgi:hypothetical protein